MPGVHSNCSRESKAATRRGRAGAGQQRDSDYACWSCDGRSQTAENLRTRKQMKKKRQRKKKERQKEQRKNEQRRKGDEYP